MPVIRPPSNPLTGAPVAPDDLQSSAMDLMGPGFSIAKVIGTTPAANAIMDFIRRQWPSLGRKADSLPDIDLSYADKKAPPSVGHQGIYYRPELGPAPGGTIDIAQHPAADSSYPAMEATRTLIHELLHAIYQHKNKFTALPNDRAFPNMPAHMAEEVMDHAGARGNYTPGRHNQFLEIAEKAGKVYPPAGERELRHGALDAMANNIIKEKFPKLRHDDRLRWRGSYRRPGGSGVQNMWRTVDPLEPWLTDDELRRRGFTPPLP